MKTRHTYRKAGLRWAVFTLQFSSLKPQRVYDAVHEEDLASLGRRAP